MAVDIQTIGVGFDTSGLVKGQQALDATSAAAARTADTADRVGATAKRSMDEAARAAQNAERQFSGAYNSLRNVLGSMGGPGGVAAAFMGGFAAGGIVELARGIIHASGAMIQMADTAAQMRQQLSLASGSAREAEFAYDRLMKIASSARVEVSGLAQTYAQVSRATGELGISQDRLLRVTETLSKAITISGGSAQSAQAAMVQLSQGLASGTLRGEELNSIMEQTPRVARALADGLGVGIGALRQMGQDGELTAERVVVALEKASKAIDAEFARTEATVGQSMTVLGNSMLNFVGQVDRASGASASMARGVIGIAGAIDSVTVALDRLNASPMAAILFPKGGTLGAALPAPLQMLDALASRIVNGNQSGARAAFEKQSKEDEEAITRWSDGVVVAYNKAKNAVDAFANDTGNLSKLDQKVAAQRKLTTEFLKVTKDLVEGSADHMKAYAAYQQGIANLNEKFADKGGSRSSRAGGGIDKAAQEQARALEDLRRAMAEADGFTGDYTKTLDLYQASRAKGLLTDEQYIRVVEALIMRQPIARDLTRQLAEAEKSRFDAVSASVRRDVERQEAISASTEALRVELAQHERATALIGATALELHHVALQEIDLRIARVQAEAALDSENAAYAEQIRLLQQLRESKAEAFRKTDALNARQEAERASADMQAVTLRAGESIERTITDSFMRSAESGADAFEAMWNSFRGLVASTVLRPFVQMGASMVTGTIANAMGLNTGMQGLSMAGSLYSAASGAMGLAAGSSAAYGALVPGLSVGSAQASMLAAQTGVFGAEGLAMTASAGATAAGASSMLSTIASAAPYVAAALLVYSLLSKKGGGPKQGGSFSTGDDRLFTPNTADSLLGGLGSGLLDQVGALTGRYGGSIAGATVSLGYDQDPIGTAGSRIASRVIGADGRVILDNSAGRDVGRDQDKFEAELAIEAQRVLLAALQASNLENGFADIFGRLDPATAAPDAITNILTLAESLYSLGEAVKGLPGSMGSIANLSATARERLVGMAGGLESLVSAQQSFMQKFFTDAERHAIESERIGAEFLRVVGVPLQALTEGRNSEQVREAFKGLVLGIDTTTDSGLEAYAAMMRMASPLSDWIDSAESLGQLASGAAQASRDLQSEIDGMTNRFGDLQGAMAEISPVAETLVDAWRSGKREIDAIKAALGIGQSESGSQMLISTMGRYQGMADSYGGARRSLESQIFETGLSGMSQAGQAAALRERAAGVWGTLQGSADPAAVISEYSDLIIRAIRAEAAASVAGQQAGFDAEYKAAMEAQRLAKESRQDQIAVLTAQREAWEDQLDALERMRDYSREIRDYVSDLRIGDLSILSPTDRIAQAAAAFRSNVAGAQAGDEASQRALTASATDYLQQVRQFYASSGPYVSAFNEVTGTLDALGLANAKPADQMTLLQMQIDEAVKQVDYLKGIEDAQIELKTATIDTSAAEVEALKAIDTAAMNAQNYLLAEVRNLRTSLLDMLAILDGVRTEQEAQIAQNAAAQSQLIELTKQTAGNTGATAEAVNAAASAPAAVS